MKWGAFLLIIIGVLYTNQVNAAGLSDEQKRELDKYAQNATPGQVLQHFKGLTQRTVKHELDRIYKIDSSNADHMNLQSCLLNSLPEGTDRGERSAEDWLKIARMYEFANFTLSANALTAYRMAYRKALSISPPLMDIAIEAQVGSGKMLAAQGKFIQSQGEYRQALNNSERFYGRNSSRTVGVLKDIASGIMLQTKDMRQAELYYREALQRLNDCDEKPPHLEVGILLDLLNIYKLSRQSYKYIQTKKEIALLVPNCKKSKDLAGAIMSIRLSQIFETSKDRRIEIYENYLQHAKKTFGNFHHTTQITRMLLVAFYYESKRTQKALKIMGDAEKYSHQLSSYIVRNTQKESDMRDALSTTRGYMNTAISLALKDPSNFIGFATRAILNGKYRSEDRSAVLTRASDDARIQKQAQCAPAIIKHLRSSIYNYMNATSPTPDIIERQAINIAISELERYEQRLVDSSAGRKIGQAFYVDKDYKDLLNLPKGTALLEFVQFFSVDFSFYQRGEKKLAALIISDEPEIIDLGNIQQIFHAWNAYDKTPNRQNSRQLYDKLIRPLEGRLKGIDTVYIAPDAFLNLFDFGSLITTNDRYWIERMKIRYVRSGRHLFKQPVEKPIKNLANGIFVYGNISYDRPFSTASKAPMRFAPLGSIADLEAKKVMEYYSALYGTSPKYLQGDSATEYSLKKIGISPHVLHIISHGYVHKNRVLEKHRPLLLSGIALSGANEGILGRWGNDGEDGVLSAEEAQDLPLDDTELVVLSACNTGLGSLSTTEGSYGTSRAFLNAGAKNILVSMSTIYNKPAETFMSMFYKFWLADRTERTPVEAMRHTKLWHINHRDPQIRRAENWAPFIIIERGTPVSQIRPYIDSPNPMAYDEQ